MHSNCRCKTPVPFCSIRRAEPSMALDRGLRLRRGAYIVTFSRVALANKLARIAFRLGASTQLRNAYRAGSGEASEEGPGAENGSGSSC